MDPVLIQSTMIAQRQRERQKEYRRERDQKSQYITIDSITDILHQIGEIPSSSSRSSDEDVEPPKIDVL